MILPGSYANGFAPRDGRPLYSSLWRGCIGAWAPCLGPTGLTLRDFSTKKLHHDAAGSGFQMNPDTGKYAAIFNGSCRLLSPVTSQHGIGAGDFTIAAWTKPSSVAGWRCIWSNGASSAPAFYAEANGGGWGLWSSTTFGSGRTLATGVWQHICVVRKSGVLNFWTNGVAETTTTAYATTISNAISIIGSELSASQQGVYVGSLDDFRIYNRALLPHEIRSLSHRRGIAYEMIPRTRSRSGNFALRRRLLLTGQT